MVEGKRFIDLHCSPFGRKGSFFIIQQSDVGHDHFGASDLWIGTTRSTGYGYSGIETTNRVMKIRLLKDGRPLPFAVSNTPAEVILETDFGSMRICISEHRLLRFYGTDGLTLSLSAPLSAFHSAVKDMLDGTWQLLTCTSQVIWLFVPVRGTCVMDAPYDWRAMRTPYMNGTWIPDENGVVDLCVEEFDTEPKKRSAYPDYRDSAAAVLKDFETYRDTCIPQFAGDLNKSRDLAAWMIWSHTRMPAPGSLIKREMVIMMHQLFGQCYCWQQAFQAMANCKNADFAWDLLQSVFDYQIPETGQIPDHIDEINKTYFSFKPPIYGVALNWLLDHSDLSVISAERKELLYNELRGLYGFYLNYRDADADGLPEYHQCDETGCEDSTMCIRGFPVASPELSAYVVNISDALSRLAALLGRHDEAKKWDDEADALTDRALKAFWNGERFIAFRAGTREPIETGSISFYTPLLFGKRLPKETADRVAADLFRENVSVTPYGVPSEALDSPYFEHGWSKGTIQSPTTCLVILGLLACGKIKEAADIARRYAQVLQKSGFYHMIDPITGLGNDKAIGVNNVQYWAAWTAGVFTILSGYIC